LRISPVLHDVDLVTIKSQCHFQFLFLCLVLGRFRVPMASERKEDLNEPLKMEGIPVGLGSIDSCCDRCKSLLSVNGSGAGCESSKCIVDDKMCTVTEL
jgi:hypothetical protein